MTGDTPQPNGALLGALGAATGFITCFLLQKLRSPKATPYSPLLIPPDDQTNPISHFSNSNEPHKLILCIRTDLGMKPGKMAAQASHATLGAYKQAQNRNVGALQSWESQAQPKIALQISSKRQADQLARQAKAMGLVTYMVHDAGRTQVLAGSMTVLAIGPGPTRLIDKVTGKLKLL